MAKASDTLRCTTASRMVLGMALAAALACGCDQPMPLNTPPMIAGPAGDPRLESGAATQVRAKLVDAVCTWALRCVRDNPALTKQSCALALRFSNSISTLALMFSAQQTFLDCVGKLSCLGFSGALTQQIPSYQVVEQVLQGEVRGEQVAACLGFDPKSSLCVGRSTLLVCSALGICRTLSCVDVCSLSARTESATCIKNTQTGWADCLCLYGPTSSGGNNTPPSGQPYPDGGAAPPTPAF